MKIIKISWNNFYYLLILNIFVFNVLLCENIDEFKIIYSKMKDLSPGNKLYYKIFNGTCLHDPKIEESLNKVYEMGQKKYVCLINNSLYILKDENYNDLILNMSSYISQANDFYYELNIYKNKSNDLDCIISFTNITSNEINIYHFEINITNRNINFEKYSYINDTLSSQIDKGLSCQILEYIKGYFSIG